MSFSLENDFYTVQEISALLKLSVLTIYKYIKEEKIEVVRFGGHYRIPRESLLSFINQHKISIITKEIYE